MDLSNTSPPQPNQILTIIHKETTVAGRVGAQLAQRGYQLDIRAPIFGDPLPENFAPYAAALVLGGPMSANDDEAYLHKEIDWIEQVLAANLPYLGICLGAQLLAKVLGAQVALHPQGIKEIGYHPIYPTTAGQKIFPAALKMYQWHQEGFELPTDAVLLAQGETFPHQAFLWGDRTYGFQFHPEATASMVDCWAIEAARWVDGTHVQSRPVQLQQHQHHSRQVARWLEAFLKNWLPAAA